MLKLKWSDSHPERHINNVTYDGDRRAIHGAAGVDEELLTIIPLALGLRKITKSKRLNYKVNYKMRSYVYLIQEST